MHEKTIEYRMGGVLGRSDPYYKADGTRPSKNHMRLIRLKLLLGKARLSIWSRKDGVTFNC